MPVLLPDSSAILATTARHLSNEAGCRGAVTIAIFLTQRPTTGNNDGREAVSTRPALLRQGLSPSVTARSSCHCGLYDGDANGSDYSERWSPSQGGCGCPKAVTFRHFSGDGARCANGGAVNFSSNNTAPLSISRCGRFYGGRGDGVAVCHRSGSPDFLSSRLYASGGNGGLTRVRLAPTVRLKICAGRSVTAVRVPTAGSRGGSVMPRQLKVGRGRSRLANRAEGVKIRSVLASQPFSDATIVSRCCSKVRVTN